MLIIRMTFLISVDKLRAKFRTSVTTVMYHPLIIIRTNTYLMIVRAGKLGAY